MVYEWHKIQRQAKMVMGCQLGYCGNLAREQGALPSEIGSGDGPMLKPIQESQSPGYELEDSIN